MKRSLFSFAAAILLTAGRVPEAAASEPVRTDSGLVEGISEGPSTVYKGIPYAAPPLGPLRWRQPEAPAKWDGVKAATRFAPTCMQRGMYPDDAPPEPMSEDCLYLNLWVPQGARGLVPVMVWIHGGGLQNGSASTPLYAGGNLAARGVIVVTVNYRLGALGFLAHPELTRESPHGASGNYGLLDQLAALRWVQRNVAAFGGDPGNVTVFGQSSGAISVSALMASPLSKGLFKRAIGQSGGLFEPLEVATGFSLRGAEQAGLAFAARAGVASVDGLRALPPEKILDTRFHSQPNIDGYVLTETPYAAFANGRQSQVDLLVGSNEHEGLYFLADRKITSSNMTATLKQDFPSFLVSLAGPAAPQSDAAARAAFVAFEGQMRFGWNVWTWARLHADAETHRVFFYRFALAPPGADGASHGAEMAYVFGHLDPKPLAWTNDDWRISNLMAAYWTNFAKTGDPNGTGLPPWPEVSAAVQHGLVIAAQVGAGPMPDEARLKAIGRVYAAVRTIVAWGYTIAVGFVLILGLLTWRTLRRFRHAKAARGRRDAGV